MQSYNYYRVKLQTCAVCGSTLLTDCDPLMVCRLRAPQQLLTRTDYESKTYNVKIRAAELLQKGAFDLKCRNLRQTMYLGIVTKSRLDMLVC